MSGAIKQTCVLDSVQHSRNGTIRGCAPHYWRGSSAVSRPCRAQPRRARRGRMGMCTPIANWGYRYARAARCPAGRCNRARPPGPVSDAGSAQSERLCAVPRRMRFRTPSTVSPSRRAASHTQDGRRTGEPVTASIRGITPFYATGGASCLFVVLPLRDCRWRLSARTAGVATSLPAYTVKCTIATIVSVSIRVTILSSGTCNSAP